MIREKTDIEHIYLTGEDEYQQRVESYWSLTSQLSPQCFVLPENADNVSAVIRTIVEETTCKFAVRSGGHSSNAGANNIDNGVTIDLSMAAAILRGAGFTYYFAMVANHWG